MNCLCEEGRWVSNERSWCECVSDQKRERCHCSLFTTPSVSIGPSHPSPSVPQLSDHSISASWAPSQIPLNLQHKHCLNPDIILRIHRTHANRCARIRRPYCYITYPYFSKLTPLISNYHNCLYRNTPHN